jgi:ABC-type multidrug transport system fused ATPase/permease subunit
MARPLSVETLLPLNEAEDATHCWQAFSRTLDQAPMHPRPVLRAMARLHRRTLYRVVALSLVHVSAGVASPLLLRSLLKSLEAQGEGLRFGFMLACALFVTALTTSMSAHHIYHILLKLMVRVRIALVAAIYRKSLALTIASRQEAPAGQIINLMGTDAQKFVNALNVVHSIWMHPIQFVVVLSALYWILGPPALAGAAVLLCFLALSAVVSRWFLRARAELIKHSDERVGLMNEILMSIRVIKFYAWERSFTGEVQAIRGKEALVLARLARLSGVSVLLFLSTPILVALATFASFVLGGATMNAADVFSALALFTVLRHAMVTLPDVVTACLEANVAVRRIEKFLRLPELPPRTVSAAAPGTVKAGGATLEWTPGIVAVDGLDLSIRPGELVVVVGAVGSGKSALLAALLGDLQLARGTLEVAGQVAYVSQQPWILNATVRQNVVFGLPDEPARYDAAIDACALRFDLTLLPAGDLTEIGERGVNLSGGQRQRISLARAAYTNADVVLLDDPLSALDNRVGQLVFDHCIMGALGGSTRILATHRLEYVDRADRVLVMDGGRVVEQGAPAELRQSSQRFRELWRAYERGMEVDDGAAEGIEAVAQTAAPPPAEPADAAPSRGEASGARIMTDEERNTGVVGFAVYRRYFKEFAPGLVTAFLLVLFILKEVLHVGTDSWLAYWSSASGFEVWAFLGGYAALGLLTCAATFWRSLAISLSGLRAGTSFHNGLLAAVMRAPMSFFEGTPVGRVLNRFSRDMEAIDQQIPRSLHEAFGCVFTILTTLCVVVGVSPLALLAVGPIALIYWRVQRRFRPASREGQRLDSVTRSPLFALFSQSLAGVPVIRAFGAVQRFEGELLRSLETNSRSFYTIVSANRWLGTRIETLGAGIVASAAFAAVLYGGVHVGFAGLAVTYALAITGALNWAVRMFSQVESNLNSVERVDYYTQLPAERWTGVVPPAHWPDEGRIAFRGFELRYRPDLPPALRNFSAVIEPGEKIGVVGRTGAGKSTLLLGLFRLVEASAGVIEIDGVDIRGLDLSELRARIAIIPQEPVLFRGSVRKNLDPFGLHDDARLWDALRRAELDAAVKRLPLGLDTDVHEGGSNFSVGQRQLLCLARAILKRGRILLLDEATASVDVATDELIQRAIRAEFEGATVITIAHRLNTVMDCDRIMVLDGGRLVEFDRPSALQRRHGGAFAALVREEHAHVHAHV